MKGQILLIMETVCESLIEYDRQMKETVL